MINMPKKIITILIQCIIAIIVVACSSTKESTKTELKKQDTLIQDENLNPIKVTLKKGLLNFEFEGEVTININGDEMTGNIEGGYIDKNGFYINIFGPFGIHFAAIEINKDTLKIANLWHKRFYQTIVDLQTTEFRLSLLDLARKIIIAEPFVDSIVITTNKDTLDFQTILSYGVIKYQYIQSNNNLIFSKMNIQNYDIKINYSKYRLINANNYPMNISLNVKEPKVNLQFQIEDLKSLTDLNKYKPINYNKLQKVDNINQLAK